MTMRATVLRFQREYQLGTALGKREVVDAIRCTERSCRDPHCFHEKVLGVYKAVPLGTLVGGNPFRRIASYARIKLANLRLKVVQHSRLP